MGRTWSGGTWKRPRIRGKAPEAENQRCSPEFLPGPQHSHIGSAVAPSQGAKNPVEQHEEPVLGPSQLRGILDHLDILLAAVARDGTLIYWNDSFARRFDLPSERPFPRVSLSELVHPQEIEKTLSVLGDLFEGFAVAGRVADAEVRFRLRSSKGTWSACIARARVVVPKDASQPFCLLRVREDRERRRSEPLREKVQELEEEVESKSRQLAESEAEYRGLLETMNDGFWVLDVDGKILFANEKLAELTGFPVSELVGKSALDFFDEENREIFLEQIQNRIQGKVGSYEIQMTRRDGDRLTCLIRGAPRYDAEGRFIGTLGNITDISVRKALEDRLRTSEKEYRDLFDNMQDIVCRIDVDGRIVAMNRAGAQILGFVDPEDVIGRKLRGFYANRGEWRRFEKELGEKGQLEDFIVHLRRRDGQVIATSVNAHIVLDERGWPAGIDGVFRDVSERAGMEEQLQTYAADLEKKNDELESLIYSITHDFKSPLIVVGGMVSRLKKVASSALDERGREYLEWIRINVNKMEKMVGDLLDFYRADKTLIPFESVQVGSLVDTVLRDVEPLAREKGVHVRKQGPFPVVKGYRNRLYQVFYNLVENAVKYTEPGQDAVVEVGCTMGQKEHLFRVQDTGPGIAPEHHTKVFQIFYTLEPEHVSGTGIGLSIAKKIIQNHGGRIWIESEPGRGTTFFFTLPAIGATC